MFLAENKNAVLGSRFASYFFLNLDNLKLPLNDDTTFRGRPTLWALLVCRQMKSSKHVYRLIANFCKHPIKPSAVAPSIVQTKEREKDC